MAIDFEETLVKLSKAKDGDILVLKCDDPWIARDWIDRMVYDILKQTNKRIFLIRMGT